MENYDKPVRERPATIRKTKKMKENDKNQLFMGYLILQKE